MERSQEQNDEVQHGEPSQARKGEASHSTTDIEKVDLQAGKLASNAGVVSAKRLARIRQKRRRQSSIPCKENESSDCCP